MHFLHFYIFQVQVNVRISLGPDGYTLDSGGPFPEALNICFKFKIFFSKKIKKRLKVSLKK